MSPTYFKTLKKPYDILSWPSRQIVAKSIKRGLEPADFAALYPAEVASMMFSAEGTRVEKVAKVVAAVRCQAQGQEGPGDSVIVDSAVCLVPPAWDGVPIHIPPSCVTIVTTADAAKSLAQNAPGKAAADFLASAATTGTGSNMGTPEYSPAACVPVQEMFGSGPGRALKTEPSSQPLQELAIAHLVGDTFEPGIPGQEDFLATHPSDMIGDMPSNDCWPGTGHFSDAFDYLPMQGPGLPFQTAPVPASNAGTQHDQHQQQ